LIWAAANGHPEIVSYLIGLKAELNHVTQQDTQNPPEHNRSALDWSTAGDHSDIVGLLLEAGAEMKSPTRNNLRQKEVMVKAWMNFFSKINLIPVLDAPFAVGARSGYTHIV